MPCSRESPCVDLLGTYEAQGISEIASPTDIPGCKTRMPTASLRATGCVYGGRGTFDDTSTGSPFSWTDQDGTPRYWCEYRPPGASASSKRPLLIYVPGSGGSADDIYDATSLRAKAESFDGLSGDAERPGFILVSTQGRNLHWPTADEEDGSKHDSYHRDLGTNRDVAFFDSLIDSLVAEGVVDPERVYLTGWSNGARFAAFYGISRHERPTPAGNRVAAVAVYSGGDPFENIVAGQEPSCKQEPYPQTSVPFLLVSRNCDAVTCDQEQFDAFVQGGWEVSPGNQVEGWMAALTGQMNDTNARWLKLGYFGATASSCLSTSDPTVACTQLMALRNHFCWPDGISDQGGRDREVDMLEFLEGNALP